MHLNPYGQDSVELAVNLANDRPATDADLIGQCRAAGLVVGQDAGTPQLEEVLEFLDRWLRLVDAQQSDERAALLNGMLAEFASYPRLTNHTQQGWHLHYRDDSLPLVGVLRALITVGTALHLAGRGMHRLGRCASQSCDRVYADFSRTGRQRYCSTTCGNRDAVRRHRARASAQ